MYAAKYIAWKMALCCHCIFLLLKLRRGQTGII
uniref:Putative ADP-ribosylation factor GTPase-activating protein AGD6 n=1 Tax=Rhizophora mucronata TaxID=61149 RepID=A0A2P2KL45_RHIMU